MKPFILASIIALTSWSCSPAQESNQPIETGSVTWLTDHDEALALSKKSDKPVFLLFQEVPGCLGCREFGADILNHPLIIESIETDFVPLLVRNNKPGREAELLAKYKEPSWNYPVVRFVNHEGSDYIPRKDQIFTVNRLLPRMKAVLKKAGKTSAILPLIEPETVQTKQVALSQYCFWTGELVIGGLKGVVKTEAGWLDGKEVTLVHYDESQISQKTLVAEAKKQSCANQVYSGSSLKGYRPAKISDQKKQIGGTPFAKLKNLTPYQRTKINASARSNVSQAKSFLSPRQLDELMKS